MQTGKLRKIVGSYTNNISHFHVFHKSQTALYGLLICEVVSLGARLSLQNLRSRQNIAAWVLKMSLHMMLG